MQLVEYMLTLFPGTRRGALASGGDAALASREEPASYSATDLAHQLQSAREVGTGVGVVIYAAAPPSRRTIGQVSHCAALCEAGVLHCVEPERVWMCRGGSAGGLKIPTNGLRDPVERFCDGL